MNRNSISVKVILNGTRRQMILVEEKEKITTNLFRFPLENTIGKCTKLKTYE